MGFVIDGAQALKKSKHALPLGVAMKIWGGFQILSASPLLPSSIPSSQQGNVPQEATATPQRD